MWFETIRDANITNKDPAMSFKKRSTLWAVLRGFAKFVMQSVIGTLLSRVACELLLSLFLLRDMLAAKLADGASANNGDTAVALNTVAEPTQGYQTSPGYQTVA